MAESSKKCAVVAIVGRPSSGKSTFLNAACGGKVSIVSPVPQTTRNAIRGIVNRESGQLVFIDTPGIHISEKKFNLRLKAVSKQALDDADAILYIVDSSRVFGEEEKQICSLLAPFRKKLVVAVNKIDDEKSAKGMTALLTADSLSVGGEKFDPRLIVQASALEKTGVEDVLDALFKIAPEGEPLYPAEFYTDQPPEFRIAEVIREQAILRLRDEIPHALYVEIADAEWEKPGKLLWVRAFLAVETESQKRIAIGAGAQVIKAIRIESMKALRKIFDYRVRLDLKVKVSKNWRQNDSIIESLVR